MIIRSNQALKKQYHQLVPGDVFLGTVASRHLKQSMMIDMLERGIRCLPSPLSQNLNGSKAAQALILRNWMLPHTSVVARRMDLIDTINTFNEHGIGVVVTKEDRMHCGHGVRKWEDIETLYNFAALSEAYYPFVIQPFLENFTDVRVIIVDDYVEAYVRYNPNNFRMNISSDGKSAPYRLDKDQEDFCRSAMARGKFPFAHLDIQVIAEGRYYLSEIALNGGIKGAKIDRKTLDQKKRTLLERRAKIQPV